MKKITIALFVIGLLFSTTAFAAKKLVVAVSFPGMVQFFKVQKEGMDKAAKLNNLEVIYADAEWDSGKQLSQVENFAARKVDLLLLCPADGQALMPAIDIAKEANIPLIVFTNVLGSDPEGKIDGIVSFIGTNEVNLGRLLGQMAERLLGQRSANIVLIEGPPGTPPQRMRSQGFKEVVKKHPNWSIVYSQAIPGWTKEGALGAMEAFLQRGQKVDLVTTHWYSAASAAATALEEARYKGEVYVTGLEFSKELVPLIKEEKVHMTSNYSINEAGYQAMSMAARHLRGQSVPKFVELDVQIISKANVDQIKPEL